MCRCCSAFFIFFILVNLKFALAFSLNFNNSNSIFIWRCQYKYDNLLINNTPINHYFYFWLNLYNVRQYLVLANNNSHFLLCPYKFDVRCLLRNILLNTESVRVCRYNIANPCWTCFLNPVVNLMSNNRGMAAFCFIFLILRFHAIISTQPVLNYRDQFINFSNVIV